MRLLLLLGMLTLATLACITQDYRVVYNPSGDGSGVVYLELTYPKDILSEENSDPTGVLEQLEDDELDSLIEEVAAFIQ